MSIPEPDRAAINSGVGAIGQALRRRAQGHLPPRSAPAGDVPAAREHPEPPLTDDGLVDLTRLTFGGNKAPMPHRPKMSDLRAVPIGNFEQGMNVSPPDVETANNITKIVSYLFRVKFAKSGIVRISVAPHRDLRIHIMFFGRKLEKPSELCRVTIPSPRRGIGEPGGLETQESHLSRVCTLLYMVAHRNGEKTLSVQIVDTPTERAATQVRLVAALQDAFHAAV
jgi:hypothetical protein